MNDFPALSIIGPGRVGTAIGVLAARAGYPVVAVGGRHRERTIQEARRIGEHVRACGIMEAAKCANLVFITVTDDAIEPVCSEIADQKMLSIRIALWFTVQVLFRVIYCFPHLDPSHR